jgi:Domain of unknown function (DUF4136)
MRAFVSRFLPRLLLGASLALLASCASGPTIRSNTDPSADFTRYQTYGFFDEVMHKPAQYASFATQYLKTSIAGQMERRGFKRAEDPELLVNINVATKDKVSVSQTPSTSMYYGYRGGMYGWGMGVGVPMETDVQNYTEGTLNIDVVDRVQKKLLWEGVAVGRIREKALNNPQPAIEEVVAKVFDKFPKPAPPDPGQSK